MPHSKVTERINFGKIKEIIAPPNLIELQTNSYKEFLQAEIPQSKRKNLGLQAVFTEVFPIGLVVTLLSAGILQKKVRDPENRTSNHTNDNFWFDP